jgi:small-conductance mechanosensitive channel
MQTNGLNTFGWADLTLAVVVLVAIAVAHTTLRWWMRRRERRDDVAAAATQTPEARARWWVSRSLRDCASPFVLLIWIHGIHAGARLFLFQHDVGRWERLSGGILAWTYGVTLAAALYWLLSRVGSIVEALLLASSRRLNTAWDNALLPVIGKAVQRLLPLAAVAVGASILPLSTALEAAARKIIVVSLILMTAWLVCRLVQVAVALLLRRHPVGVSDNLKARAIHTQVIVLQKVVNAVVGVFTLASVLMVFDTARQFGATILASAGLAGIVVGLAAQRSIGTLLAGFQIAVTQPIRVDDVVIVEGEWGQVEDITLTYAVVRLWDRRRLIVPITFFIETPFQNWTHTSADILGSVFLHVDYTTPIDDLRDELTRILQVSPFWNGKVNALQVTDAKEHTLEVRALASAANATLAWELRCEIRERLVAFMQEKHPEHLPRLRASVSGAVDSQQQCSSPAMATP